MKRFAISLSFALIALTFSACNDQTDSAAISKSDAAQQPPIKTASTAKKDSISKEVVENQAGKVEDTEGNESINALPTSTKGEINEFRDAIEEVVQDSIQEAVQSAVGDEVQKKTEQ
jgi:hypothetical protein